MIPRKLEAYRPSPLFALIKPLVLPIVIFTLFFLVSYIKAPTLTDSDEALFHFPNVLNFYNNGFNAIIDHHYSAANTPLPYIIIAAVSKLFSPTLLLARIVTCIISLFSYFIALRLLKNAKAPQYYALSILFFPYFLNSSFYFYAGNYGIFFTLWGLLVVENNQNKSSYGADISSGILFALGILCQQFYLMAPAAIILFRAISIFRQEPAVTLLDIKKMVISNLLFTFPMILPGLLFIEWGGLTHPNFSVHSISFYPSTIVAILFITGFYFFPYIIQEHRKLNRFSIISSLSLSIVLPILFTPKFSDFQGPGIFTGFTYHLITLLGKIHPSITTLSMMTLTFMGILVFTHLFATIAQQIEYIMYILCALLAIAYSCNTLIGERHLLGLLIILLLLVLPRIKKPIAILYPLYIACIVIGFFVWFTFFIFH